LKVICVSPALGRELGEHASDHRPHGSEHVVLCRERHLDVELVELARAAVGARVLVTKAGCDLKVAIEPGDHIELLILLRCLRQRVEPARVQSRWDQEVAGTFGRAGGQDRRLQLGEARLVHPASDARDHGRAQADVALHDLAPQVEEAIAQPALLGRLALGIDLQGQGVGGGLDQELVGHELDRTRRQARVDSLWRPRHDRAGDRHDAFQPHVRRRPEERRLGMHYDLGDPGMVAQVDEQELAVIAFAMHPAAQACDGADVGAAELAAMVRAVDVHDGTGPLAGRGAAQSRGARDKVTMAPCLSSEPDSSGRPTP